MASKEDSKISTQPYRGTKDQFPEDQRIIDFIVQNWHAVAKSFGYENYAGPILEPIELYLAKTSEEIVREQLYHVYDLGERHLAIRPEMTPTLARMVASRVRQLAKPIRWYSIATCMRFERPQKSRLRQFDQFNLDILGGVHHEEDVEVLLTIVASMKNLGAKSKDFQIRINHRELANDFLVWLKVAPENMQKVLRLMDAADKMEEAVWHDEAKKLGLDDEAIARAREYMSASLPQVEEWLGADHTHLKYLHKVIEDLKFACPNLREVFCFSPGVMRGFDYYTGMVFEVFDISPDNRRALFGGGRYDNLVESFGGDPISGVGYGVSEISLINFMKAHDLLPDLIKPVDVLAFAIGDDARPILTRLAMEFRMGGIIVEQGMGNKKAGKNFAYADKLKAKACVFMGDEELGENQFAVKWLSSSTQEKFSISNSEAFMTKLRSGVFE